MRRLFTTEEALRTGLTMDALRWGVRAGRWRRVVRGVYGEGPDDPGALDIARARVVASPEAAARGHLAGVLHGLDGVGLSGCPIRRGRVPPARLVFIDGVPCADGRLTMIDLAATLDDAAWEQALESALRKRLTTVAAVEHDLRSLGRTRTPGTARIRRMLILRPPGAPATGSLLETLMVQLVRRVPNLGEPVRQYVVCDADGQFIARVDLAWPEIGLFIELDGQQHKDQPVYDARRETAVVAATGWLPGRFTWLEVVRLPNLTRRRLEALAAQARRRVSA